MKHSLAINPDYWRRVRRLPTGVLLRDSLRNLFKMRKQMTAQAGALIDLWYKGRKPVSQRPQQVLCCDWDTPQECPLECLSRMSGKLCAVVRTERIANRIGWSSEQPTPRRTAYPTLKGEGDKSMLLKRGESEDV